MPKPISVSDVPTRAICRSILAKLGIQSIEVIDRFLDLPIRFVEPKTRAESVSSRRERRSLDFEFCPAVSKNDAIAVPGAPSMHKFR